MKNANRMLVGMTVGAMWLSASLVHGQDWPQWRGVQRDAKASGFQAPAAWPQNLTQKWKVAVGSGDATPVLVAGKLYVFTREGSREVLRCLDAATGREVWQQGSEAMGATGPASRHAGPRATPVVAEGKVVIYGVRGALTCLEAATGKVVWRKDDFAGAWPMFFTASSPLVIEGRCIAQLGSGKKGGIVAYRLATGEQQWQWTGDGTAYASPVLMKIGGNQLLVTLTEKNIVALGVADGKLYWQTPFAPQRRAYNAATPIVQGQTIIYTGASRGTHAVRVEMHGDALTAQPLWDNPDYAVQFNSPVLHGELLFGISQRGDLFCLQASTGKTAWTAPAGGRGFGSLVDAGTVMLALTPEAKLLAFAPTEKAFQQLASYKVADSATYAYPVITGNRIYIKDQNSVTLWTLD